MTMSLHRPALVATTLAATVLLPVAPALAETLTIKDATSDAWEEISDPQTGEMTYVEAGSPVNSDIVRTVVRHNGRSVKFRTRFVQLRNNEEGVVVVAKIRTNEGLKRFAAVLKDGSRNGTDGVLVSGRGREVRCPGMTQDVDWAGDTVEVKVPRACLSRPRWVQVVVAGGNHAMDGRRSYVDVAGTEGHRFSGWSEKISRG